MRPDHLRRQQQTTFGGADAPDAEKGNCYSVALACLLAVPLAAIPNFMTAGPGGEWYVAANKWLLVGEPDEYDVLAVVDIDAAARFVAHARSGSA